MELLGTAMLALVFITLGSGLFWGFVRKLYRTLLRFLTLAIALGCAFLFTKLFGGMIGRYVVMMIQPLLGETVGEFLAKGEISLMADAVFEIVAAPILFILFYLILKIIFWIIYKILVVSLDLKGPRICGRMTGALAGLLCGLVGLIAFVTPVFGYITLTNKALNQLAPDAPEVQELSEALTMVTETPVAKECYQYLGQLMFTELTTAEFDNAEISLEQETSAILYIVQDFATLSNTSAENFGEEEALAVQQMAQHVGSSKIVSTVVASLLSDAAKSWLKGEEALGMAKLDLGKDLEDVTNAFLTVFSTSTSATLPQDLSTFAGIFEILLDADIFSTSSTSTIVTKLGGILNGLYAVLDANPRMIPVKSAIRNTGVRFMMDQLGVGDDMRETHGEMLENMANTLKNSVNEDGTVDKEVLSGGINEVLKENGNVSLTQETTDLIAEAVIEHLTPEEIQTLPPEVLADRLAERFLASDDPLSMLPDDFEIPDNVTLPDGFTLPGNITVPQ